MSSRTGAIGFGAFSIDLRGSGSGNRPTEASDDFSGSGCDASLKWSADFSGWQMDRL